MSALRHYQTLLCYSALLEFVEVALYVYSSKTPLACEPRHKRVALWCQFVQLSLSRMRGHMLPEFEFMCVGRTVPTA